MSAAAYIGIVLGAIALAFALELLIVGLYPHVSVPRQDLERRSEMTSGQTPGQTANRREVRFDVKGTTVSAWLFLPDSASSPVPCIVMAHGLGGTRSMGLAAYAARYQQAGMAALAFDYRYNGDSEGDPRQLIWIRHQLEDYAAAIRYARGLKEIDPEKIALWGTSLSGGHVLVTAARDDRVACVAAQCPLLDGTETAEAHMRHAGIRYVLRMAAHGQRDLVRSWLGLSPHRIPIVGKPGTIALMANTDAWRAFAEMAPDDFANEGCARIAIRIDKYRPVNQLGKVNCPVLLQVGDQDMATPAKVVSRARRLLGQHAEVIHYPIDHFDFYRGENLEQAVNDQVRFFKSHLLRD